MFSKRSVVRGCYPESRDNTHYAERLIMPSVALNGLWGKGSAQADSA